MEKAVLTSKGQLQIPKQLLIKYDFKIGGKVVLEETEQGILIIPMNQQYFKSFVGILQKGNLSIDKEQMKNEENY